MARVVGTRIFARTNATTVTVQIPDEARAEDAIVVFVLVGTSSTVTHQGYSIRAQGELGSASRNRYLLLTRNPLGTFSRTVTLSIPGAEIEDWSVAVLAIRNPLVTPVFDVTHRDARNEVSSGSNATARALAEFTAQNVNVFQALMLATSDRDENLTLTPDAGPENILSIHGQGIDGTLRTIDIWRTFYPDPPVGGVPSFNVRVDIAPGGGPGVSFSYVIFTLEIDGPDDDVITGFSTSTTIHEGQRSISVAGERFSGVSGELPTLLLSNEPTYTLAAAPGAATDRQVVRYAEANKVVFNADAIQNLKPGFAYMYVALADGYANEDGFPFIFERAANAPNIGITQNVVQQLVGATDIAHKLERLGLVDEGLDGHPRDVDIPDGFRVPVDVRGLGGLYAGDLAGITIYARLKDAKTLVTVAQASSPYSGDITTDPVTLTGAYIGTSFSPERTYFFEFGASYSGHIDGLRPRLPAPPAPLEVFLGRPRIVDGALTYLFLPGPSEQTEGPVTFSHRGDVGGAVGPVVAFELPAPTSAYDAIWQVRYALTGTEFARSPHMFTGGVATQAELYATQMQVVTSSQIAQGVSTGLITVPPGAVPPSVNLTAEITVGLPRVPAFYTNPEQYELEVLFTDFEEYLATESSENNRTRLFLQTRTLDRFSGGDITMSGQFLGDGFSPERIYALVFSFRNLGGAVIDQANTMTGGLELSNFRVNGPNGEIFEYDYGGTSLVESRVDPGTGSRFLEFFFRDTQNGRINYGLGPPVADPDDSQFTIRYLMPGYLLKNIDLSYRRVGDWLTSDTPIDGDFDVKDMLSLSGSAAAGKLSGAGTDRVVIRDVADGRDSIIATVDSQGNRLAIDVDTGDVS